MSTNWLQAIHVFSFRLRDRIFPSRRRLQHMQPWQQRDNSTSHPNWERHLQSHPCSLSEPVRTQARPRLAKQQRLSSGSLERTIDNAAAGVLGFLTLIQVLEGLSDKAHSISFRQFPQAQDCKRRQKVCHVALSVFS